MLSEKQILNETKNHNPPFKLNGRSLINGTSSTSVPVTSGVPQGTVLCLIIFLIYTNDLPKYLYLKYSKLKLFADDSIYIEKLNHIKTVKNSNMI